ncbi:putative ribonuclease H-like domain-containing protein [Tanacetum coccineum]
MKDVPSTKKSTTKPKPTKKKAPVKANRGKGLNVLSEVALSKEAQLKKVTKRSKKDFYISHASGLGNGTDFESGVPDKQHRKISGTDEGTGTKPEGNVGSQRNMMNVVDIENLTIEQYLMLTQENLAQGMARTKSGRLIIKDIKNMTIAEYIKYEAEIKRDPWGYAQSYTRSSGSTILKRSKENKHHPDKLKTNTYFLSFPPCFKPAQPFTKDTRELVEKDPNDFNLSTPNSHHEDEEGISFVTEEEEEDSSETLPCQLPPKEINPGSFTLPCTIGSLKLYDMADLGACVNVMPKSLFEHLELADLKETNMVVEMADITKKAPLGIVENILLKIDKFLFYSDFVVIDMLEGLNETMLLGRPFLVTIHAQIDVFRKEISLGIGEEKVKFDINGEICHSRVPVEKIYMASFVQDRAKKNLTILEIENDVLSYDSPACLLLEQGTPSCSKESIDTVDSIMICRRLKNYDFSIKSRRATEYADPYDLHHEYPHSYIPQKSDSPPIDTLRINTYFPGVFRTQLKKPHIRDNSFEEWVKIKLGHTNVSETIKYEIFKEWIKENFDFEVDFGRTLDDPYFRRL